MLKSILDSYLEQVLETITSYVSELNEKEGGFETKILTGGLSGEYIVFLKKTNVREVEKIGWFGGKKTKKVKEHEPVMSIAYSTQTSDVCIFYDPKWEGEAKSLEQRFEKRLRKNPKLIEKQL